MYAFVQLGVLILTVTKVGDFVVDFLCEFETIFKKALTIVLGARR
jgi:hypothetical protein